MNGDKVKVTDEMKKKKKEREREGLRERKKRMK
jgi:hypothetical protein